MLTEDELTRIRELADRALRGPWEVQPGRPRSHVIRRVDGDRFPYTIASCVEPDDARFIAEARSAVPMLLDELDRLHQALRLLAEASPERVIDDGVAMTTVGHWVARTIGG